MIPSNPIAITENEVTQFLLDLGVQPNLLGYHYLKDACSIVVNADSFVAWCDLYEQVAKKNNTTASRTERAIRHAVYKAYEDNFELMGKLIKPFAGREKKSVSLFVSTVVEILKLRKSA